MTTRIRDLTIHEGLSIVKLDGFKPEPAMVADDEGRQYDVSDFVVDPPGSANWLCEQYGMSGDELTGPGILWTDYDAAPDEPWAFSVLVASDETEALAKLARDSGYSIESVEDVVEPTNYGDGHAGTVEILKHRDGWVILEN